MRGIILVVRGSKSHGLRLAGLVVLYMLFLMRGSLHAQLLSSSLADFDTGSSSTYSSTTGYFSPTVGYPYEFTGGSEDEGTSAITSLTISNLSGGGVDINEGFSESVLELGQSGGSIFCQGGIGLQLSEPVTYQFNGNFTTDADGVTAGGAVAVTFGTSDNPPYLFNYSIPLSQTTSEQSSPIAAEGTLQAGTYFFNPDFALGLGLGGPDVTASGTFDLQLMPLSAPEPGSCLLAALGLGFFVLARRRWPKAPAA